MSCDVGEVSERLENKLPQNMSLILKINHDNTAWQHVGFVVDETGLGRIFSGFLPFSHTTIYIPPFPHTHLIHFVSIHQPW